MSALGQVLSAGKGKFQVGCWPMTSLHQYEAWLDELDAQLQVDGEVIVYSLGEWSVQVAALKSSDDVARWATTFHEYLLAHDKRNDADYLVRRFVRLAKQATALSLDVDEVTWEVTVGYR
jgi:hypothetical protein